MAKQTVAADVASRVAALGLQTSAGSGFTPANPASTTSTSLKMMGLACTFTPSNPAALVVVSLTGLVQTAAAAVAATVGPRYGTGSAPANGAAVTGTRFGAVGDPAITGPGIALPSAFAFTALLQLIQGTAYWFDVALATANSSDAASITDVGLTVFELP